MSDDTDAGASHGGQPVELDHRVDDGERTSLTVLRAVATLTNTPVLDLEPLYHVVDPDHLDRIARTSRGSGADRAVTFSYSGCRVTVTTDAVRVQERDDDGVSIGDG